jgi:AI-2 transport protein TqsA
MGETDYADRLRNAALAVIALGVILTGLIYGRSFLIPLAIAILLWNLLEAVIERFTRIRIGKSQLPRWLAALLGIVVVVLGLYVIQSILVGQIDAVGSAWPRYMSRLESIVGDLTRWLGAEQSEKLKQAIMRIDLTRRIAGVVSSAQFFLVSFLLIIAYVGFLFLESAYMRQKIAVMFSDEARACEVSSVLTAVSESVRRYIWIKTVVSTLTAIASYAILRLMGVAMASSARAFCDTDLV